MTCPTRSIAPLAVALACLFQLDGTAAPAEPGPVDKDAPEEFTTTKSGLKYRVLRKSKRAKPSADSIVQVHYRGWLPSPGDASQGRTFDSSYRRGEPVKFPLSGVIPGWTEGLQLVGEGGMIELVIPPKLGYGERGGGPIPPNATLRFVVELLDIVEPLKPGPRDPDAPAEFTVTPSGLKYRILRRSDKAKPTADSTVVAHYRGWLPDPTDPDQGKEFDSSYQRGEPAEFPLRRVVPGWTEGLQLVGKGGMIELEIPPRLGYGARGAGPIPPNATLRFIVELLGIAEPSQSVKPAPRNDGN